MSNLKHQSLADLKTQKTRTENYISELNHKLNNQKVRLQWINTYIDQKTIVDMSMEEIERRIGHRINIV